MASHLSTRLLTGGLSTVSISGSRNSSPTTIGRNDNLSGYSADKEGSKANELSGMGSLPCLIDLYHHRHKRKPEDADERATRRKMNELCYDAATVKDNLERAGRPYLLVGGSATTSTTHRLRIAPFIDISQVRLIHSNSTASAATTAAAEEPCSFVKLNPTAPCRVRYDILTDFGAAYQEMIHQTAAAYQVAVVSPLRSNSPASESMSNSSGDSSSSLSDTESDDSCRGGPAASTVVVATTPRLDDNPKIAIDTTKVKRENPRTDGISFPVSTVSIPMEEAVGVCDSPRLVTLSSPPYKVIFCNAAFAALTGLSSDETLGKSLHELVTPFMHHGDDNENDRVCLESCAASSSEGKDTSVCLYNSREFEELIRDKSNGNNHGNNNAIVKCGMKVLPIISRRMVPLNEGCETIGDTRELNNRTHFSLELLLADRGNVPSAMGTRGVEGPKYVTAMA